MIYQTYVLWLIYFYVKNLHRERTKNFATSVFAESSLNHCYCSFIVLDTIEATCLGVVDT